MYDRFTESCKREDLRTGMLLNQILAFSGVKSEDIPDPLKWFGHEEETESTEKEEEGQNVGKILEAFFNPIIKKTKKRGIEKYGKANKVRRA